MVEQEPSSEAQRWRLKYWEHRPSSKNGLTPALLIRDIQIKAADLTSDLIWRRDGEQSSVNGLDKQTLEERVADIVVSAIDMANHMGFDLEAAVKRRIIEGMSSKPVEEKRQNI